MTSPLTFTVTRHGFLVDRIEQNIRRLTASLEENYGEIVVASELEEQKCIQDYISILKNLKIALQDPIVQGAEQHQKLTPAVDETCSNYIAFLSGSYRQLPSMFKLLWAVNEADDLFEKVIDFLRGLRSTAPIAKHLRDQTTSLLARLGRETNSGKGSDATQVYYINQQKDLKAVLTYLQEYSHPESCPSSLNAADQLQRNVFKLLYATDNSCDIGLFYFLRATDFRLLLDNEMKALLDRYMETRSGHINFDCGLFSHKGDEPGIELPPLRTASAPSSGNRRHVR